MNFEKGQIEQLPIAQEKLSQNSSEINNYVDSLIQITKSEHNKDELSFGFIVHPLVGELKRKNIESSANSFFNDSIHLASEVATKEESLNRILAEVYELSGELIEQVSPDKVTLFTNPAFRFDDLEKEDLKLKSFSNYCYELLSYSVGCMMGRFSLDRKGLVYARSANEGFKELETEGAYQTFPADDDGIIPLASEEWLFDDDATTRFKEFVKTVWGEEHLSENLKFVAESLCLHALKPKKGESVIDTIRRYFSTQFFKDHCKTYKKRPIYWLFSSGKEKAFECLVYLHRYNEGTLSRMRTEYVTPLMGKYESQHTLLSEQQLQATGTEARHIEKDLKSLEKKQAELRTFDEQLKHYAEMRITLDLDDGVKANYGKFGNLLADVKTIHGKAVK